MKARLLLTYGVVAFSLLLTSSQALRAQPASSPLQATITASPPPQKVVKILSIDGGGIRGIIPALVLKNLESRLKGGKHLADCFDVMAGNSTGGIITLLLNTPDAQGRPKYTASHILQLYEDLGHHVFQRSLWHRLKTGSGWWGAKYAEEPLESLMATYFGDIELKDTIKNVMVPAYEIEKDKTFFFKTSRAKKDPTYNYFLKDIARATSAAPTYFHPAQIQESTQKTTYALIDGGVSTNNPTLAAAVYAAELYGKETHFFIVSLGTGTSYGAQTKRVERQEVQDSGLLGWAKKITSLMMYAVNDVTNYEMHYVFNYNSMHKGYFRFQPIIEARHAEMDDTSESTLTALHSYAEKLIQDNEQTLQEIADVLNEGTGL